MGHPAEKVLPEGMQGRRGVVLRGLHFDGMKTVLGQDSRREQKVDFDVVPMHRRVVMRVEIQGMAGACQHLGDEVFVEHALVDAEAVVHELFVCFSLFDFLFGERLTDEEPGIAHIAFHFRFVGVERQSDIRVAGHEAEVCHHGILEPEKGFGHAGCTFRGT